VNEGSDHLSNIIINYSNRRRKMIYIGQEATKRQLKNFSTSTYRKENKMSKRGTKYFPEQINL